MARVEAGRAKSALTQIRLSTLQGLHELVTHLTLGQTRRLLGGTVAPAGACSGHRNPRRGRKELSEALHLERLRVLNRPYQSPLPAGQGLGVSSSSSPMVKGGDTEGGDFAKVTQGRRISSTSPELAQLHVFRAAEAPVSREDKTAMTCPSSHLPLSLTPPPQPCPWPCVP